MKKLVLLGLVLTLATGCGRSWLPMFRGASCLGGGCGVAAPALPPAYGTGCSNCGQSAGYSSYDDGSLYSGGVVSGDTYYGGEVIQGPMVGSAPTMQSLPASPAGT